MAKNLRWRALLTAGVLLVSLIFLVPTFFPDLPGWWSTMLPTDRLRLGLDLKGGMHLVLGVQLDKAIEGKTERRGQELKNSFRKKRLRFSEVKREGLTDIVISYPTDASAPDLKNIIKEFIDFEISAEKPGEIRLHLRDAEQKAARQNAIDQGLKTIQNRVDGFGVSEAAIVRQGDDQMLVELPGIKDPKRATDLIGKTALLEFKMLDEEHSVDEALQGNVPPGSEILYERVEDKVTGRVTRKPFLVKSQTMLTGDLLTNAKVEIDSQFNRPYVGIEFSNTGAVIFEEVTGENIGKHMAIILDSNVYSAPVIKSRIAGGRAVIEGQFTNDEAHDLSVVLRAGALPAPVEILENRTVGPSLGADLIRQGLFSIIVSSLLVLSFMVVYYNLAGLVADFAVLLNIVIVLACLAAFKAALTMPGIAGLVLTVGMAVDANVLVNERIREELRIGRGVAAAVDAGYHRALSAIIDSNVTTIIAALVLWAEGTGPVRGFAVVLTIGLLSSMFTAVFVTRIIFDYFIFQRKIAKLSI